MQALAIGLVGGIASAVLYIAAFAGSLLGVVLLFVAPLPILISGLGWGLRSAATAALCGIAVTVADAFYGEAFATSEPLSFAALIALPAAFYAVLYATPITLGQPAAPRPASGRLLPIGAVAALIALGSLLSLIATTAVATLGWSIEDLRAAFRTALVAFANSATNLPPLSDDEMRTAINDYLMLIPLVFSSFWFLLMLANLWLAARVTAVSGQNARPKSDVAAELRLPPVLAAVVVIAFAGSFLSGTAGTIARAAFGIAFMLSALDGLALVHLAMRRRPGRVLVLALLYALMTVTLAPLVPLGVVGLVDIVHPLRVRIAKSAPRATPTDKSEN